MKLNLSYQMPYKWGGAGHCPSSVHNETAQDVITEFLDKQETLPPHKFETKIIPNDHQEKCTTSPVTILEAFMDGFIGATNK